MRGLPGSGKSTVAREISRRLGVPLIDKDDVKDLLDGQVEDAGRYAYDIWLRVIERQLRQGLSVVCDSPLTFADVYQQLAQMSQETGSKLVVIECSCPDDDVLRQRIEARAALNLPAHHQTEWPRFLVERQRIERESGYEITAPLLELSTLGDIMSTVEFAIQWLRDQNSGNVDSGTTISTI